MGSFYNNPVKTIIILNILLTMISRINCEINGNTNFDSVPTTVKTFENDTVLLPCYYHSPFRYVRWIRDDTLIVDSRNVEITPRITLFSNGSLLVNQLRPDDTGDYICEIMTYAGFMDRQVHAIEVQHPPSVVSNPSGIIEVNIGSSFEIICDATGIPQPIITWRRQGKSDSNQLDNIKRQWIEVSNKNMAGLIECIANNGVGDPAIAGVNMIVLFPPEIKAEKSVIHTKLGLRAILECHVMSAPAVVVHWFHHGVPVMPDMRIARHDTDLNSNKTNFQYYAHSKHILIIKKVKESDLGIYECRAENKLDFKGTVIELTGRPMPSVFKTSPLASTPMTHNLIWQTESLSEIFEYKLKFRQIPSGNITPNNRYNSVEWNELVIPSGTSEGSIYTIGYVLRGLMPASVYEVTVTSRNRYGWSDMSKVIRFATGGEIEVPNLSTETIDYESLDESYNTDTNSVNAYSDYSSGGKTNTQIRFYNLISFVSIIFYNFFN